MKKKTTLILLSILHICVFCIGILIIFRNLGTDHTNTTLSPDTDVRLADNNPDTETPIEETIIEETIIEETITKETLIKETITEETIIEETSETLIELPSASETQTETLPESEPPSYTFQFIGKRKNLNIRKGPSLNYEIIGKIPPLKSGRVLELTNKDWALIEYNGITGYSSLHWMELTPAAARQN